MPALTIVVAPHLSGNAAQAFGTIVLVADQGTAAKNRRLARRAYRQWVFVARNGSADATKASLTSL